MANYAHNVNRVTLSGTMFGGNEIWSTGFFMGQEGADAADPTQAMATKILAAWETFFEGALSFIGQPYATTQCKVAKWDDNGQTLEDHVYYAYPGSAIVGSAVGGYLPPQCSLVVTLLSDRPRGKASKGRMFLPGITTAVEAGTGRISAGTANSIATNLKTFFDALTGDLDIPDQLILAAKSSGVMNINPAQNDYVETIRVGNVIDTQRRRRNNLPETYTSKVLA